MKKKDGVIETYYDNGQLESRENYKDRFRALLIILLN